MSGCPEAPLDAAELARAAPWLPPWAVVSAPRVDHIRRVAGLLEGWGREMALGRPTVESWRDAGRLHDSLRDAGEAELREITGDYTSPVELLHGPAAAERLAAAGEERGELLEAVRFHTTGWARWGMLGRALYMADYLDPGRPFQRAQRAFMARRVPTDFETVFQLVLAERVQWAVRDGLPLPAATVELWNSCVRDDR